MARNENSTDKDFLDIDLDEPLDLTEAEASVHEEITARPDRGGPVGDGILLYDNKRYAVGLKWLMSDDEGDSSLAKTRAKGFKADFYVMRQGVVTQHGFGFLSKGHRLGQSALASLAADALVGEWHAVFVADNGWWYVAVHSDNLSPDGDILFASEEAAYNHFMAQMEAFRWPRSYAPESWNAPDTSGEIPLSRIVNEATAPALKPVNLDAIFSGKRNKRLAFGALITIVILLVISLAGQTILTSFVPTKAELPAPIVNAGDNLQTPPKEPSVIKEESGEMLTRMALPAPSALMTNCIDAFSALVVSLPGWKLTSLKCKDTLVEGYWNRQGGSYDMVEPYLSHFPDGVSRNFADAQNLVANRRLPTRPADGAPEELLDRSYAIITLTKRFANIGQLTMREVVPAASQQLIQGMEMMQQSGFNAIGKDKVEIKPLTRDDMPYISLEIKTRTPPNLIGKYFDIPGLIFQGLSNDITDGTWMYNAKLVLRPDARLIAANTKAKQLAAANAN